LLPEWSISCLGYTSVIQTVSDLEHSFSGALRIRNNGEAFAPTSIDAKRGPDRTVEWSEAF